MKCLNTRFKLVAYFILAILSRDYCLPEDLKATSAPEPAVAEAIPRIYHNTPFVLNDKKWLVDVAVFQSDGLSGIVARDVIRETAHGLLHSRTLKQRNGDLQDENEFQCGLSSSERRRYFDDATNQWVVTNEVLRELSNDVQAIVNCTSENDIVVFRSTRVITSSTTITLPWTLTLRSNSTVTLTCPRRGPLIVTRTPHVMLENLVIVDCNGTSSVIVLSPRCGDEMEQGMSLLRHLTFQDNGVFEEGHIIEANGRCSRLNISGLVFLCNRCVGAHCVVLGARNILTDIYLANNQGSNETSLDSSIFFAAAGSETIATNITSMNNTIRSFYLTNSTMRIIDSRFAGNRRNQSSGSRDTSIGGGVIFTDHCSISISNSTFERNYALNGGALFAWSSDVNISDCRFQENEAGEGNGGVIYGHHNSSLNVSTSIFSENRGYFGAAVYSNYTMRVDLANLSVWKNNCSMSCAILIEYGIASIESSDFLRNSADRAGAALCTEASNLTLKDSIFNENTAKFEGACVFQNSNTINASNLLFENNTALESDGGGILFRQASRMTLRDSVFRNNYAHDDGGAICTREECKTILKRVVFSENSSGDNAGALQIHRGNFSGTSLTFIRNQATSYGGAIGFFEATTVIVSRARFKDNSAEDAGAIQFYSTRSGFIDRCTFVRNSCHDERGGAIYVRTSNVSLSTATFRANAASIGGSVCCFNRCNSTIRNTTFLNNTSETRGGSIDVHEDSKLTLENSTLVGNNGGSYGGGVCVSDNSTLELTNVRFASNEARWGGALYMIHSSNATVSSCSFINNTALDNGGGVRLRRNSSITVLNSTFTDNKASLAGGLGIWSSSLALVLFSSFARNNASTSGGGIYLQASNMFLSSTRLDLNSAEYGGSLYSVNASFEVINSTITRSNARGEGGAIYMSATNASIDIAWMDSNEALEAGGGIAIINASLLLCYSCLILNNRASSGAGLYVYSNNSIPIIAQLQNSRFENNSAESYGGGIEFAAPQNRSVNCSSLNVTCGHIVLLNTSFVGNYANHSGAIVLTTDPKRVLVDCEYKGRRGRNQDFVNRTEINSLKALDPKQMCASWMRNRVSSNAYGGLVGTYGQDIVVSTDLDSDVKLVGSMASGYVLENVRSGRQLPTTSVTIVDGYGEGPALTLPHSFEARISSPDDFFVGMHPTTIVSGVGKFSKVIGLVIYGNYSLQFEFDNEALETFNVTVMVRECIVGEEPTRDGLTCQECDAFSYNFDASQIGGCKECPNDATCRESYIVPKNGHWHRSPCHDTIQECLVEESCTYEARDDALMKFTRNSIDCNMNEATRDSYNDVLCNEGYKGPLCGSCKKSFGLSVRYLCLKCASTFLSLLTIAGIALYLLGASSLTIRGCLPSKLRMQYYQPAPSQSGIPSEPSNGHEEINFEMVKMIVEGHVPREYFQKRQEASTSQIAVTLSNQQETEHELTRWKITEIFKTVAVAATISVRWTSGMLSLFEGSEYVGAMSTVALSRPVDCITFSSSAVRKAIWRMLVSLFIPSIVVGTLVSIWGYLAFKQKNGWSYFWKRFTLSVIAVTYISYLGLTKMAVRAFYCVSIYNSSSPSSNTKEKFWAVDTAIKCYGKDHSGIIAIAVIVIFIITVCFPLISAIILSRNKEGHKKRDSWVFETAGFLFRVFKEKLAFWESVVMFRKACLSVIVVFAYPLGGDIQGLLASVLLLFCLYLQLTLKPYRKEFKSLNQLKSVSLLVSAVTFNLGLFFINDRCSEFVRTLLATVIVLGNSLFFMFLVFSFSCSSVSHLRVALRCENVPITDQAPWWRVIKVYATSRSFNGISLPKRRT